MARCLPVRILPVGTAPEPKTPPHKPERPVLGPSDKVEILKAVEHSGDIGQVKALFMKHRPQAEKEGWFNDLEGLCKVRKAEFNNELGGNG